MSVVQALQSARLAGLHLQVEGEDLVLEAAAPPPSSLLELLRQHKAEVIALLRCEASPWSGADWQAYYNERAGITEYDGGLSRPEAEAQAYAACLAEWLEQNPVPSIPHSCLHCGRPEEADDPPMSFGPGLSQSGWVHPRCWDAWHVRRRDSAASALAAMGITEGRPHDP